MKLNDKSDIFVNIYICCIHFTLYLETMCWNILGYTKDRYPSRAICLVQLDIGEIGVILLR
jgi:hypothetical protein